MAGRVQATETVHVPNRGRCECSGECGYTHAWTADTKKQPCGAPDGCTIVRKKDHESFWQLAASDTIPLEHAEHYSVDKPILVELKPVEVRPSIASEGKVFMACQRCKLLIEQAQGTGKRRRGKSGAAAGPSG